MKILAQEHENGQAVLRIEVEPPELEKSVDTAFRDLSKKTRIPGFRKGKVPRHILEGYLGKDSLQQEALEKLIPQLCGQVAQEQELDVIAQPQAEILEMQPAVVFKATFPLRPKVELGDYRSTRIDLEPVEVTEEQIDATLDQLRNQRAIWVPVERPVQFEDMAVMDIEQRLEAVDPISYEGQQLPIVEGSPLPVPGFSEQVAGMEKGQEKEFTLSFPNDHESPQLAGMSYTFKVRVTEIKERKLPDLDDEFAKSLEEEVETVDALRGLVAERLRAAAEQRAKADYEAKALQAVVDAATVEFPPVLVDHETDQILKDRDQMLRTQGGLEAYLRTVNKTEEEIKEELRPQAVERLKRSLVLGKFIEVERLDITAPEIDAEIEKITTTSEERAEELRGVFDNVEGRRWVHNRLEVDKAMERLTDIVSGKLEETGADVGEVDEPEEAGGPDTPAEGGGEPADSTPEAAGAGEQPEEATVQDDE